VILSGYLDDGSAGLYAIRNHGGIGIVQDPSDAVADSMPATALQYAGADYVLPAGEIGEKILELVGRKVFTMKKRRGPAREQGPGQVEMESPNLLTAYSDEGSGTPSVFACPECHGVLWEIKEGKASRYRCRVGHAYGEATLDQELNQAAESALWAAMRALEEKAAMARRVADAASGSQPSTDRLRDQAATYASHAEMLRKMIFGESATREELPLPRASQG
jgi:two-component system chemotaxis response regulator CheB